MNEDLDIFADELAAIGSELQNADTFFAANGPRWLDVARRTAVQTLLAHRPDELDEATWKENAVEFAELLMLATGPDVLEISFVSRTEFDRTAARNRGQNLGNFTPITWQDVHDWVTTPREEGGKDRTLVEDSERMRDRADRQITHDVYQAVRQHQLGSPVGKDFSGIAQRLEDFVNSRVLRGDIDALLRLVLEAWFGVLAPIMERDFADWIHYDVLGAR